MLERLLIWVGVGGGGLILAYYLVEKWKWLRELDPEPKRYAAFVLAGFFGVLAFLGNVGMLYIPQPTTWREWVAELVSAAAIASTLSQFLHGRLQLSKKSHAE